MDITLCIPTRNRPEFILRVLLYYQSMNFHGKISIGDSSDVAVAKRIKDSLSQFANSLEISYRYLPGYNVGQALLYLAEEINTAYVTSIPDDDFLIPSGISKCMDFLNVYPDYVAAHGVGVILSSFLRSPQSVEYVSYYPQPVVSEATAVKRLNAYLANYTVSMFSVHRTKVWQAMFKNGEDIVDRAFGHELLQCCLSVILGKIKQLDGLYLIRQDHENRHLLPNWFEWITNEAWYPSYSTFRDCLVEAIVRQDEITLEEAKLVVEKAFAVYLAQCISGNTSSHQWRSIAKQIPGARTIWNALEPLRNKYCLSNILRLSSPYYKDFMPIYKIVTQR